MVRYWLEAQLEFAVVLPFEVLKLIPRAFGFAAGEELAWTSYLPVAQKRHQVLVAVE